MPSAVNFLGSGYEPADPVVSLEELPTEAVEMLKASPHEADMFEEVFGPGSASVALGQDMSSLAQITRGAERGVRSAFNSAISLVENIDYSINSSLDDLGIPTVFSWDDQGLQVHTLSEAAELGMDVRRIFKGLGDPLVPDDSMRIVLPDAPITPEGQLSEGVAQYLTGFAMTGGIAGRAVLGAGAITRAAAQGFAADFVAFDEDEENLSDFIQSVPGLENPVTQFLAGDESDGWLESRLKTAFEGLFVGVGADLAFRLARSAAKGTASWASGLREARHLHEAGDFEGAARRMDEARDRALEASRAMGNNPVDAGDAADRAAANPLSDDGPTSASALEEDAKRLVDALSGDEDAVFDPELFADILNPKHLPKGFDTEQAFEAIAREYVRRAGGLQQGSRTQQETLRLAAERLNTTPDAILDMYQRAGNAEDLDVLLTQLRMTLATAASHSSRIARQWSALDAAGDVAGRDAASKHLENVLSAAATTMDRLNKFKTELGRGLAASKIDVPGSDPGVLKQLKEITALPPAEQKVLMKRLAKVSDAQGHIFSIDKILDTVARRGRRALLMQNEFWINAILSGPRTHLVNMLGNAVETIALPFERGVGGVIAGTVDTLLGNTDAGVSRISRSIQETADSYSAIGKYQGESLRKALNAFAQEQNILDPLHRVRDDTTMHEIPGAAGKVIRLPSRFLASEDEYFKQINYRAFRYTAGMREARQKGIHRQADREAYADDYVSRGFNPSTGAPTDIDALEYARRATFTSDLGEFGQKFTELVDSMPILRNFVPFIRTPTNLLKHMLSRTPLGFARPTEWKRIMGKMGPQEQAEAWGRFTTATAMTSTAAWLAYNGFITGSGPSDPRMRNTWLESNQPYSVKIGDKWVEIRRLDPRFSILGVFGELAEISKWGDDPDGVTDVVANLTQALSTQIMDRSYFQGLSDILDALNSQNEARLQRWVFNRIGSYIPNVARQANPDQEMKDIRNELDALIAGIPMLSGTVEPNRSPLTGEPLTRSDDLLGQLTPLRMFEDVPGHVAEELLRQEVGLAQVADRRPGGRIQYSNYVNEETGQTALDRIRQLVGKPIAGKPSLTERLEMLFADPRYQELSTIPASDGIQTQAAKVILNVVDEYRQAAILVAMQEYPELARDIQAERANQRAGTDVFELLGGASQ